VPAATLRTLLAGLIDYAGLFPPAALDMTGAVTEYAAHRTTAESWMLGRFIVPVSRLEEFTAARSAVPAGPWLLSVLPSADLSGSLNAIEVFNSSLATDARIDTIEMRLDRADEIEAALALIPPDLMAYVEIPIGADVEARLEAVARGEGRAKVRTGGVTAEAFPTSQMLARFIGACAAVGVPFKATAGLHHPLRGEYRLTYEPGSPNGTMFGFLNVFLAAGYARAGLEPAYIARLLEERDARSLTFTDDAVTWRGATLSASALTGLRHHVALAFGSCSFSEPVDDLRHIGLL
jgi:hypothetical protein